MPRPAAHASRLAAAPAHLGWLHIGLEWPSSAADALAEALHAATRPAARAPRLPERQPRPACAEWPRVAVTTARGIALAIDLPALSVLPATDAPASCPATVARCDAPPKWCHAPHLAPQPSFAPCRGDGALSTCNRPDDAHTCAAPLLPGLSRHTSRTSADASHVAWRRLTPHCHKNGLSPASPDSLRRHDHSGGLSAEVAVGKGARILPLPAPDHLPKPPARPQGARAPHPRENPVSSV